MADYRDKEELRRAYNLLNVCEEALRNGGFGKPDGAREFVIKLKRKIREATKRVSNYRIVSGDYDYYVELIECPEEIQTVDAARDYFYDNFYREYFPEPWDCTGQLFTNWYHIAQRRGRMIIYHSVSRDV